jgi:hypothetical protein
MRDRHRPRPRQMMPFEPTGAFTLACMAVLALLALVVALFGLFLPSFDALCCVAPFSLKLRH